MAQLRTFSVTGAEVSVVSDSDYAPVLRGLVDGARHRVWSSVFIVQLGSRSVAGDPVLDALRRLADARWRGVDVRLLVGGSRTNLRIAETVATSLEMARQLGVPARGLGRSGVRGSHTKLVVADDHVLTGSHNWSPGAFGGQVQDSLLVHSADLAAGACDLFVDQWRRAGYQP